MYHTQHEDSSIVAVVVEQNGIKAIVRAMNKHPHLVGVQRSGCDALFSLANAKYLYNISNANGHQALVNAAHHHSDQPSVVEVAHQVLEAMGF